MTLPNPNASQKHIALKNNPFIWGNIVLLAGVPWLLGQSMAGLAVGNPVFPAWFEILLLGLPAIALGAWIQWQQPLYPFNLWFVSKPVTDLSDRDRQVLTLIRQHRNGWYLTGWIGLSAALVMGLVFFKMYNEAPLAQGIAPFPAGLRLLGIVWAEVFLVISNVLLQSGISAIRIQFTDASELSSLSPFAVEKVKNSFTNISWRSPLFLKFFEVAEAFVTLNEPRVAESVTKNQPETIDQPIVTNELAEENDIHEILELDNQDKPILEESETSEISNLNDEEVIEKVEELEELDQDNYLSESVANESIEIILNTEINDDITADDLEIETVGLDDILLLKIEESVAELVVDLDSSEELITEVPSEENLITNELVEENDVDEILKLDNQDTLILEELEIPEISNLNHDEVVDFIGEEAIDFTEEIDELDQENYLSETLADEAIEVILNIEANNDITVDDLEVKTVGLDDISLPKIEEPVAELVVDLENSEELLTKAPLEENIGTNGLVEENDIYEVLEIDNQDKPILEELEIFEINNLNDEEIVDFTEEIDEFAQENYLAESITNEAVEIILNNDIDDITVNDLEVEIVGLDNIVLLEIEKPVAESVVDLDTSENILTEAPLEENLVTEFEQDLIVEDLEIEVLDDYSFELLETTEAIANLETTTDINIALETNITLSNEIFVEVSLESETQEPTTEVISGIEDLTIEVSENSPKQLVEENPEETSIVDQPTVAEVKLKKKPTELLYKSGKPSIPKKQRGFGKSTKSITTTPSITQPHQQLAQSEIEVIDDIPQEEDEVSVLNVYVENILQEYLEDQSDELALTTDLEVAIAEAVEANDLETAKPELKIEQQFTDSQDKVSSHLLYESLVDQFLEKLEGLNKEDRKNQSATEALKKQEYSQPQSATKTDEVDEFADLEALLNNRTFPQSSES